MLEKRLKLSFENQDGMTSLFVRLLRFPIKNIVCPCLSIKYPGAMDFNTYTEIDIASVEGK